MKTFKEVLNFCTDSTIYNHYSIERDLELNHMGDCIVDNLSEYVFMDEKHYLRVLGIVDDISLTFIDKKFENLVDEVNNFRVGLLQLICLEVL